MILHEYILKLNYLQNTFDSEMKYITINTKLVLFSYDLQGKNWVLINKHKNLTIITDKDFVITAILNNWEFIYNIDIVMFLLKGEESTSWSAINVPRNRNKIGIIQISMHSSDQIIDLPATQAVRKQATLPATMARNATMAMSLLRSGAIAPNPPIWIPIELMLLNPHIAKVAIVLDRALKNENI